jgi:hypothetical protein
LGLVGQDVQIAEETFVHPAVAPALVLVGYLMIRIVALIDWSTPEDAVPAFLVIAGIPMTFSIAAGIGVRRHRLRRGHGRAGARSRRPPPDVGDRAAVRPVLRGGLAERQRVLTRREVMSLSVCALGCEKTLVEVNFSHPAD